MADSFIDSDCSDGSQAAEEWRAAEGSESRKSPEVRQTTAFGSIENVAEAARQIMNQKITDRPVVYKDLRPESERSQIAPR